MLSRCYPPISLLQALEDYFGCEVTKASFYETDCDDTAAPLSYAKGDYIVIRKGLLSPLGKEGIYVIAHEVCHLRRQAEHSFTDVHEAEVEADFHALLFTLKYLSGKPFHSMRQPLPLADRSSVKTAAWGLGGLFSLKQLITDGYAKQKGYAYFYRGPHEWLTQVAAALDKKDILNYVTKASPNATEYNLILGSEMNDMYFLPEIINEKWGKKLEEINLRLIAEESDYTYLDEYGIDTGNLSTTEAKDLIAFYDNNEIAGMIMKDVRIPNINILWFLLKNTFDTIRILDLIAEKRKKLDEALEPILAPLDETITEFKQDMLYTFLNVLPKYYPGVEDGCLSAILRFSFTSLLIDKFGDTASEKIYNLVNSILFEEALFDENKKEELRKANNTEALEKVEEAERQLEEKMKTIKRRSDLNDNETTFIKAFFLLQIWWEDESIAFRNGEAVFARLLRGDDFTRYFDDQFLNISEYIKNLAFSKIKEKVLTFSFKWVTCQFKDHKISCTETLVGEKEIYSVNLEEYKETEDFIDNKVKEYVFDPVFDKLNEYGIDLMHDYVMPIIDNIFNGFRQFEPYYDTILFLLQSHTGQMQFLHSMDCSNGCSEWNRRKMIRWCRFCYDCNKEYKSSDILDKNILEYLLQFVPSKEEVLKYGDAGSASFEKDFSENKEYQIALAKTCVNYYDLYAKHYETHEEELLLAAMLLPLCVIFLQMNNCKLAAKQAAKYLFGFDEEKSADLKQAKCFDICLVIALRESVMEDDGITYKTKPVGLYRSPISDMTMREFFNGKRDYIQAKDTILGMTMHMIEDSFTPSHTVRAWNCEPGVNAAPIITFADYTKQEAPRHACADYFVDSVSSMAVIYCDPDMFDIEYEPFSKEKPEKTVEDLKNELPFQAAQTTVGAVCAFRYAKKVFDHVTKGSKDIFHQFDEKLIKSIYPLIGENYPYVGNAKNSLRVKDTDVILSEMNTPLSGRCYEKGSLKEEKMFEKYAESIINSTIGDSLIAGYDKRLDELNEAVEEYRKYLFKHFAPNRYPSLEDLKYYEKEESKKAKKDKAFSDRVDTAVADVKKQRLLEMSVDKNGECSEDHVFRVLDMYLNNDLKFLEKVLKAPFLCKSIMEFYKDQADKRISNVAEEIAETVEKTHERYIAHLHEIILNAVGICEQKQDLPILEKAEKVILEAYRLKEEAEKHWEDAEDILENKFLEFINAVKTKAEKMRNFIRVLIEGFDRETIKELIIQIIKSDNPEEFQDNCVKLLEELRKMLENNESGKVILQQIDELYKKYPMLNISVSKEEIKKSMDTMIEDLTDLFTELQNIEDIDSLKEKVVLPEEMTEYIERVKNDPSSLYNKVVKTADEIIAEIFNYLGKIEDPNSRTQQLIRTLLEDFKEESVHDLLYEYLDTSTIDNFQINALNLKEEFTKILRDQVGGETILDQVNQMDKNFPWLISSNGRERVPEEAEYFTDAATDVISQMQNMKDLEFKKNFKLKDEIKTLLKMMKERDPSRFKSDDSLRTPVDSAVSAKETVLPLDNDSISLFENYMNLTLDKMKNGEFNSAWASDEFGPDNDLNSIIEIGRSFAQALKG
ncbi:MAG: hypothetical protein J5643_00250 [Lachnospiraceae bacterium]|nr:hypothetical protein [Lachnospiraceae bacterium]